MADLEACTALGRCLSLQGPAETDSCNYVAGSVAHDDLYPGAEMQALLVCMHCHRHCGQHCGVEQQAQVQLASGHLSMRWLPAGMLEQQAQVQTKKQEPAPSH